MGCFDETCAMTNLPIHYNDPIVYVGLSAKAIINQNNKEGRTHRLRDTYMYVCNTYNLMSFLTTQKNMVTGDYFSDFNAIDIVHGVYNDYGCVEASDGSTYPHETIRRAALSDLDSENYNAYFFLHKDIWDMYHDDGDCGIEYHQLYRLAQSAWLARIQLFANYRLVGDQHADIDTVIERKMIQRKAEEILSGLFCAEEYNIGMRIVL